MFLSGKWGVFETGRGRVASILAAKERSLGPPHTYFLCTGVHVKHMQNEKTGKKGIPQREHSEISYKKVC